MADRNLTHGLADALSGLLSAQLASIEERHQEALTRRETEVREQVARDIEAIDREGVHACDALTFSEAARVARGLRQPTEETDRG